MRSVTKHILMRRLGQITAAVSLACVLLFAAVVFWSVRQGTRYLSVQSGSMMPAIAKGDIVVTQPSKQYGPGDVITFRNTDGVLVTHRVQSIDRATGSIITKGDHNQTADAPVRPVQVVGIVKHVIPNAGIWMTGSRPMLLLAVLVYGPALFIVVREIRRITQYFSGEPEAGSYTRHRGIRLRHPKFYRRTSGVISVLAVGVYVASAIVPVMAQMNDSAQLTGNTITAVRSDFAVCQFPDNEALLSYALEDAYFPELGDAPIKLQKPIVPGTYRVHMVSKDKHSNFRYLVSQPNERWFFELTNGNGKSKLVATSPPTDDLPDSLDSMVTTVTMDIPKAATGIRYVHRAASSGLEINQFGGRRYDDLSEAEKRTVVWNSIHPGCIIFTRLSPPGASEHQRP